MFLPQTEVNLSHRFSIYSSHPAWVYDFNSQWRSRVYAEFYQQQKTSDRLEKSIMVFLSVRQESDLLLQSPHLDPNALKLEATYLVLPEIHVDFTPHPEHLTVARSTRYSWPLTLSLIKKNREKTLTLERIILKNKKTLNSSRLLASWHSIREMNATIASRIRYLDTWNTPTSLLREQQLRTRDDFKPKRDKNTPWIIENGSIITLHITTDIQDEKFLSDWLAAIEVHWNQSPWAQSQQKRIVVDLKKIHIDEEFLAQKRTLEEHLTRHFQKDRAILTTGGQSLVVYGRAMVLSPGKFRLRTLGHEVGHLLGFEDCYFRTIENWGPLGTAVVEFSNPYFANELMCNSESGINKNLVW